MKKFISCLIILFMLSNTIINVNAASAEYTRIYGYKNNYAVFQINTGKNIKKGLLDINGKEVIPAVYDDLGDVNNDVLLYKKDKLWGILNKNGTTITHPIFSDLFDFTSNVAQYVRNKKWGIIDSKGKYITKNSYTYIGDSPIDPYDAFVDGISLYNKGGVVKTNVNAFPYSEYSVAGGKWGIIDKNGKIILSAKYDKIGKFYGGYAVIKLNNKYGVIDKKGKEIIKPKFDSLGAYSNKVFVFGTKIKTKDSHGCNIMKYGITDIKGKILLKPTHDYISSNEFTKLTASSANFIIPCKNKITMLEDLEVGTFKSGVATYIKLKDQKKPTAKNNITAGVISKSGKTLTKPVYTRIGATWDNGLAVCETVSKGAVKTGVLNTKGKYVLPLIDHIIGGYKDSTNNSKDLPMLYNNSIPVCSNYKGNNSYSLYNKEGYTLIDGDKDIVIYEPNVKTNYLVYKDLKTSLLGLLDKSTGKIVMNAEYRDFSFFSSSILSALNSTSDKLCIINLKTKTVINEQYATLTNVSNNRMIVKDSNNVWFILDINGKIIM